MGFFESFLKPLLYFQSLLQLSRILYQTIYVFLKSDENEVITIKLF